MIKNIRFIALAMLIAVGGVGCKSAKQKKAESLAELLSQTGTTYSLKKTYTLVNGFVVLQNLDTGEFVAFNANKFDKKTMKTPEDYLSTLNRSDQIGDLSRRVEFRDEYVTRYRTEYEYDYVDVEEYDFDGNFVGYTTEWQLVPYEVAYQELVTNKYVYYERGSYIFEHNGQYEKDLEAMGALAQAEKFGVLSGVLTQKFGLSTGRADEVARLVSAFSEVSESRELTEADYKALYVDLLGADMSEFIKAKEQAGQGQAASLNELVKKASELNAISPEQVRIIMNDLI